MVNKVILVGRIGNDPEQFTFDNGNIKTSFSLATNENYKDNSGEWQEKTEWHNIALFRESKLKKGDLIYLEGKVKTRKYQDKNNEDRYVTEINAYSTQLLSRKETTDPNPDGNKEFNTKDDLPF